jgi:hypothetical protein
MVQLGLRLLCGALSFCLAAGLASPRPALAQGAPEIQAPRFLIQTLTVEGTRREASRGILIEESLLKPGQTYSERELREAIYRVRRLPFVFSADFSLRKGSERGTYELVVTVQETTRFFFGREVTHLLIDDDSASYALGYTPEQLLKPENKGLAGLRLFVGSRGVAFAALSVDNGLQAGYTRYGLFGTRAVATVGASRNYCCPREVFPLGLDPDVTTMTTRESNRYTAAVAMPLAGNHSVRTRLTWSEGEPSTRRSFLRGPGFDRDFNLDSNFSRLQLDLKWVYDNTDDPLFPSDGVTVSAGLELSDLELTDQGRELFGPDGLPDSRAHLLAVAVSGQKTWPLTQKQAASASLRTAVGRSNLREVLVGDELVNEDVTALEVTAGLRHSLSLWGFERARRLGELRLETTADYGYEALSPQIGAGSVGRFQLGTSLAFRNRWGLFRFGLSYLDFIGDWR